MAKKTVEKRLDYFNMKEFVADKAYSSREILKFLNEAGLIPYIPFRSNVTQQKKGMSSAWGKMLELYTKDYSTFYTHYHRRSNVETVYSMIKRKFGFQLHSKIREGQINEVLFKCLCHNLAVLVHELFELGIEIDFNKCADEYLAQECS